jgi:hippurate hydrolase
VKNTAPEMVSEDFSVYGEAGVPLLMLRIGATRQAALDTAAQSGVPVPSLHSAKFAPEREPTIKAAATAEVLALRELMPAASGHAGSAR